ncbi:HAD family hydrolase [Streptomyces naphthomycinicus]|uniref:HAD family hydrolase n=1 Tax=Streptomyces naphthomycinicus TaxID=2872625 RepID=UPI001CEC524F|nr:HAD family hydrolase [Streptomyces sp. TML10]
MTDAVALTFSWSLAEPAEPYRAPAPRTPLGVPAPKAVLLDVGMTLIHPSGAVMLAEIRADLPGFRAGEQDCAAALVAAAEARHYPLPVGLTDDEKVGAAWGALLGLDREMSLRIWKRVRSRPDFYSELDPETEALLTGLRSRGVRVGAVSNGEGQLGAELRHFGIDHLFDVALDSAVFGVEKPAPDMFRAACSTLDASPESCWFVGDGLINDVFGSLAAGVAVSFHYDRYGLYSAIPGVHRITRLVEVLAELDVRGPVPVPLHHTGRES